MSSDATTADRKEIEAPLVFEHPSSQWIINSQRAADLHNKGVKFWCRKDLENIEREISQSYNQDLFTILRIDGTILRMRNPMRGISNPIWNPVVQFQNYWELVKIKPDGPPETHLCSYLVDWTNQAVQQFDGYIENCEEVFRGKGDAWNASQTCALLQAQIQQLLEKRKVSKIICFGLGDFIRRPPVWWRVRNSQSDNPKPEWSEWEDAMIQHWAAITVAETLRELADGASVRLLTQDPKYTDKTKAILEEVGFEVVGAFGAGGFAEIDEETVVISIITTAPVKQIIADIARPVSIISLPPREILSPSEKLSPDAESPRTREMWQEYTASEFPVAPDEIPSIAFLKRLKIFTRIDECGS